MYSTFIKLDDVSFYQDNNATPQRVDFVKMYAAGKRVVVIRRAFSMTADEDGAYNWQAAADAGLRRISYGFLDYRSGAPSTIDQGKFYADLIAADPGDAAFCDFEQPNASWPALPAFMAANAMVNNYMGALDTYVPSLARANRIGIYGNLNTLQALSPVSASILRRPLWIAAWPLVPAGMTPEEFIDITAFVPYIHPWPRWTLWQYTSHANGPADGTESLNVDQDLFNGTIDDYLAWAGASVPVPPVEETLDIPFVALQYNQNIRSAPVVDDGANILGQIQPKAVLTGLKGIHVNGLGNIWAEFAAIPTTTGKAITGWAAVEYGNQLYLKQQ